MHTVLRRRHSHLADIISLFELAFRSCSLGPATPRTPTSTRLRRDLDLPGIEKNSTSPATLHLRNCN